ncbi:MAG: TonB family protein [Pyrinomonadaceae bacterium]
MLKRTETIFPAAIFLLACACSATAQKPVSTAASNVQPVSATVAASADTDRTRDGLNGPVRRIRTESAKLSNKGGKSVEESHVLLETAAYDIKGAKTENAYFPVTGATLTGKETYKYDDKGNIVEMTLHNADGSLLSKETYTYEFDFVGNWTKMTTSVAVIEGGKVSSEPTEVTYRSISYYLDEKLANMMNGAQPTTSQTAPAQPASSTANSSVPSSTPAAANKQTAVNKNVPAAMNVATVDKGSAPVVGNANSSSSVAVKNMEEPPPNAPAPSVSAPKPLLKPISGGVLNGKATSLPMPRYPETARRMRVFGTVDVEVVIDTNGKVISAHAANGPQGLREAAAQAATMARFSPTMLSGQPVKVSGVISYKFVLPE